MPTERTLVRVAEGAAAKAIKTMKLETLFVKLIKERTVAKASAVPFIDDNKLAFYDAVIRIVRNALVKPLPNHSASGASKAESKKKDAAAAGDNEEENIEPHVVSMAGRNFTTLSPLLTPMCRR